MGLAYFITSIGLITAAGILILCFLAVIPFLPLVFLNLLGFSVHYNTVSYVASAFAVLVARGAFYKYRDRYPSD